MFSLCDLVVLHTVEYTECENGVIRLGQISVDVYTYIGWGWPVEIVKLQ